MNDYYVYVYLDPRKPGKYKYGKYRFPYEPIYVGKGKEKRIYAPHTSNFLTKGKINKIELSNNKIIPKKVYEGLSHEQSLKREKELIKLIGRINIKTGTLTNLTDGGQGNEGWIVSEETKKKISIANTGRPVSKETREKQSESNHWKNIGFMTGKHHSKEAKEKISKAMKGENHPLFGTKRPLSVKLAVSKANKGRPGHNKGKHLSEETKKKLSLGHKGKSVSEETKRKISKTLIGRIFSDEHKKKIGAKHKGKIVSEETRKKLSESLKRMNDEKRKRGNL